MDSTTIKIWEMVTGNMLEWSFAHPAMVVSLAFSPLATHIITAMEDSSAWMWDLTDGSLVAAVYCHEIMSAVFLGDHLKAILQGPLHLQLWDTTYYGPTTPLYDTNTPFEEPLMMSSDRSRLLCGRTVYLVGTVAPTTLQKSFDLPSECDVGVFSPDGRYVACWAKHLPSRISVVAVTDGSSKCEIECSYGRPFASVAFNVESTHLLVLLENSSVHIWDLSNPPRPTKVLPILFPKDPTLLQSRLRDGWLLGEDGQPLIWLPDSMQKVRLLSAYRHGRLVLEDTNGGPIVLDMADYLKIPQAAGGWRDGDVEILGSNNEASVLHRCAIPHSYGYSVLLTWVIPGVTSLWTCHAISGFPAGSWEEAPCCPRVLV
ncbi:hypothetical protein BV22DRAFT_855086 [Leucogyrophana mollusca]|uniref:Uncharacterized protein n=1 Tax=Leucogyrophana mollusca TaxID=85980 RepID=A0ACB8B1Z1_9AGAM|nr:hypothetical protein BV22DRAFT_855086 [Leucogyrophana mollusca]